MLSPDPLLAKPFGSEAGRVLLEERLSLDPVRVAGHHERTIAQVAKDPGGDRPVVRDQVSFGVSVLRPEDLLEVREPDGLARGLFGLFRGFLGRLVVAQAQEDGVAELAVGGPFLEAHLADDLGIRPDVLTALRQRSGRGRRGPAQAVEPVSQLFELAIVEARPHTPHVAEALAFSNGQMERAEADPSALR